MISLCNAKYGERESNNKEGMIDTQLTSIVESSQAERVATGFVFTEGSFDEEEIEEAIGKRLAQQRWTLAVAESCTGGQVSRKITKVAGSSRYFLGGVVAYQNRIKTDLLGVPQSTLLSKGAVSSQTAVAMAEGVRKRFNSRLGIAVTGIAGPGGGTRQKPIGLVYFAMSDPDRYRSWQELFTGDREQSQERATKKALEYLWRWIWG
jgi:nicotinamide-nucleotide amidase